MTMKNLFQYIVIYTFLLSTFGANAVTIIRHNLSASQNDASLSYELALLTLILDKSSDKYGEYKLLKAENTSQSRAFLELKKNSSLDIIATMTSIERENLAEPIRICLFKGLLGVRIPIVLKDQKKKLENTSTLSDLQKLSAGQVFDWPDAEILERNKITVEKARSYPLLFPMLKLRRFNLFPLGALEVFPIVDTHEKEFNVVAIERWAIAYPTGYYFFVSKSNKQLEQRIRYGFDKIIEDVSFNEIFDKFNIAFLQKAMLNKRKIIYLKNPLLPQKTPLQKKSLWHPLIWDGIKK